MKKCPYCAEEIQDGAIKCKHCGEFLNRSLPPRLPGAERTLPWYFRTPFLVVALLSVLPFALPLVWWHPHMKLEWKAGITGLTLLLSWGLWLLMGFLLGVLRPMLDAAEQSGLY